MILIVCLQGAFQLYIKAREIDPVCSYCDSELQHIAPLDDIFINRTLVVNTNFTPIESYNGTSTRNRVVLDMRFRVMCQQHYYGADCTRFCRPQNDSVNRYYCTCNSNGFFQCRKDFRNPSNNCSDGSFQYLEDFRNPSNNCSEGELSFMVITSYREYKYDYNHDDYSHYGMQVESLC